MRLYLLGFTKKSQQPSTCSNSTSQSNSAAQSGQTTIEDFQIPALVVKAEIVWALKVVMSHFSLRSCLELNDLFKCMFPDSQIASKISLSKTKCSYIINFGLAPYFSEVLLSQIKASSFFVISYGESLNKILRNEQMDCSIRFWNNETCVVCSRYFDSKFLLRPNSKILFEKLLESTKSLDLSKLPQLSMDGPNVNWDVLKLMSNHQEEKEHPNIINLGSFSLHVIHGALQRGINSQNWELAKIFRAMHNLFKESPARIDKFMKVCESDTFTLS